MQQSSSSHIIANPPFHTYTHPNLYFSWFSLHPQTWSFKGRKFFWEIILKQATICEINKQVWKFCIGRNNCVDLVVWRVGKAHSHALLMVLMRHGRGHESSMHPTTDCTDQSRLCLCVPFHATTKKYHSTSLLSFNGYLYVNQFWSTLLYCIFQRAT